MVGAHAKQHDRVISKDGKPIVQVEVDGSDKTFTPEEISAMILTKVRLHRRDMPALETGR